jgi:hypothetical protein
MVKGKAESSRPLLGSEAPRISSPPHAPCCHSAPLRTGSQRPPRPPKVKAVPRLCKTDGSRAFERYAIWGKCWSTVTTSRTACEFKPRKRGERRGRPGASTFSNSDLFTHHSSTDFLPPLPLPCKTDSFVPHSDKHRRSGASGRAAADPRDQENAWTRAGKLAPRSNWKTHDANYKSLIVGCQEQLR